MTASSGKNSLKEWLPQGFVRLVGPHFGRRNRFEGKFADWGAALERASGYNSREILERVKSATLQAVEAEAVFERDGVLLEKAALPFTLVVDGVLSYGFRRVEFKGFILDKTNT